MSIWKNIELYIRNKITSSLSYHSYQQEISEPAAVFTNANVKRLLVLRQDRIGDVLVSVPILQEIRKALPNAQIDILLSHRNYGAKRAFEPFCNKFYKYGKNALDNIVLLKKLRHRKYDLVLDLYDNASTTSSLIVKLAKPKYSLGIEKANAHVYSHLVPLLNKQEHHIVDRITNLLLPFYIKPDKKYLNLAYPISDEDKIFAQNLLGKKCKFRFGINLSGSTRNKFWGLENHISLINKLSSSRPDYEIVCFGTEDYSYELTQIEKQTSALIAPKVSSIHEWACLLSTVDMLMTPDTAAVHLAAAWKIPALCMYELSGQEFAGIPWTPYNSPHILLSTESGSLTSIKINDVLYSIYELEKKYQAM